MFSDKVSFSDSALGTFSYTNTITRKSLDIPLTYRSNGDDGSYFEIGPFVSISQSTEGKSVGASVDVSKSFASMNYGAIMGFGQYVGINDKFGFMLGLRFGYTINDVIEASDRGKTGSPIYTQKKDVDKFKYEQSHPLFALVVMEFNFDLGYTVSAKCGKSTKFLLF